MSRDMKRCHFCGESQLGAYCHKVTNPRTRRLVWACSTCWRKREGPRREPDPSWLAKTNAEAGDEPKGGVGPLYKSTVTVWTQTKPVKVGAILTGAVSEGQTIVTELVQRPESDPDWIELANPTD